MPGRQKLEKLRKFMTENELDAYLVLSTDPHQSEYVARAWQRRSYISGFDGSAGTVVVLSEQAGLWTDSRYFLQAEQQLLDSGIELYRMGEEGVFGVEDFLKDKLRAKNRVGIDARTMNMGAYGAMEKELGRKGIELCPVEEDLVEKVWGDSRPALPGHPIRIHPGEFAGQSVEDKLLQLRYNIQAAGAQVLVSAALDEIAWLFNLRGMDVDFNPVFIAYAVIDLDKAVLFVDPDKVTVQVRSGLPDDVMILPYESFDAALYEIGKSQSRVWVDPVSISFHSAQVLEKAGAELIRAPGSIPAAKAEKNQVEIACMRKVHQQDGVAMVKFLSWFAQEAPAGRLTEISVVKKLEGLRSAQSGYVGPSFSTISGFGAHAAIVHYRVDEESDTNVKGNGLLLVDSGAQYQAGTTDITRTLAVGAPDQEQIEAYTAVLKGHLQLLRTRFPAGTDGHRLDVIARLALWELGLDYGHGTGHGVGAALCVHEGPFSVSPRKNLTALVPGNILSIEPGFYKANAFGVRIENLALVVASDAGRNSSFLEFEPLTLCPYERRLIDLDKLSSDDMCQIDAYHQKVWDALNGDLSDSEAEWLQKETKPL
jgi:Xaa-Pro aminopeptidase